MLGKLKKFSVNDIAKLNQINPLFISKFSISNISLFKNSNKYIHFLKSSLPAKTDLVQFSLTKIQKKKFSDEAKIIDDDTKSYVETNKEQLGFKAETKKLLDIVTHSLYTDKEIFLRELLSNCSDALEKQRFMEVNGQLPVTGEPLFISINSNEKNRTVTIFDSGIGMTRHEMIDNLGTIAKSGTQNFVKSIKEQQKEGFSNESLIGQFGVGFYSSFIVGETVEVISRPQGQTKATHWVSDGNGEFQVSDVDNPDFIRGTKVVIHLKIECRDFTRQSEIQKIIKKYSNFISYSIKVNGEVVNNVQAIWYRDRKDITAEEYQKFYEMISSNSKAAYKYLLHFSSDVPLDIKALLYIPGISVERLGMPDENIGLSLYSKKILIKPRCQELLPSYLRFVKGVIDCSDIPLSISRESYQDSSLIYRLKVLITKRIFKKLEEEISKDPENYNSWHEEFNQYLKEGIMTDHDNQKNIFKLLRFKSTFSTKTKIGIEDYIKNMVENQNKIYYVIITNDADIESNVFLENYKGSKLPILICNTPLDEMIFRQINEYNNFKFLGIESETDDFLSNFKTESGSTVNKIPDEDITPYTLWIKNELEPFVSKVSISKRLKNSPLLITSAISTHMKTFMAMMTPGKDGNDPFGDMKDFIVEINPSNDLIISMNQVRKTNPRLASLGMKQLYETGLMQSGIPFNNKDMVQRNYKILQELLNSKSEQSQEDVKTERLSQESLKDIDENKKNNSDLFSDFKMKDK